MRKKVALLLLGLMLIMAGCSSTAAVGPSDVAFLRDHGWTASEGKVVGAYLDRLGHFGFAASLRRRTFAEIVGKSFGQWLEETQVVDYAHPAYQALAQLQPEQLIRAYWDAIDRLGRARKYALGPIRRGQPTVPGYHVGNAWDAGAKSTA